MNVIIANMIAVFAHVPCSKTPALWIGLILFLKPSKHYRSLSLPFQKV